MGEFDRAHGLEARYFSRVCSSTEQVVGVDVIPGRMSAGGEWERICSDTLLLPEQHAYMRGWLLKEFESNLAILAQHPLSPVLRSRGFFMSFTIPVALLDGDEWIARLLQLIQKADRAGFGTELEVLDWGDASVQASTDWSFEAIRDSGAKLALGGFPSGARGFSSLARHRFDRVKVGPNLIPSMYDSIAIWTKQKEILKGLVSIISALDSETVLAGIEREVQLSFFRELAVAQWEGSYWGGATEFSAILDRSRNPQRSS